MTVTPSCPALLIHDDDAFRRALVAALDQNHFSVTFAADGPEAMNALKEKSFNIVLLGVDLRIGRGLATLQYLQNGHRPTSLIILGDPDPELRTYAGVADETLLKPVDPNFVARRARVYCGH